MAKKAKKKKKEYNISESEKMDVDSESYYFSSFYGSDEYKCKRGGLDVSRDYDWNVVKESRWQNV